MTPSTYLCPFCKIQLKVEAPSFGIRWRCENCKCKTDSDISRYTVICYKLDDKTHVVFEQYFSVDEFYIKNYYDRKITTLCVLTGGIIKGSIDLPFKHFDFENVTEEQLLNKFKLWWTFS